MGRDLMKNMNWISAVVVMVAVMALMLPAAGFAGDQLRTRDKLQLKDTSCQNDVSAVSSKAAAPANDNGDRIQDKTQDKLHDQEKDQLKLQDGSCQLD